MTSNNAKLQYDIYKTCRACLLNAETEMKSIFNCNLKDLYTVLTNLEIKENDGLPSNLCINCVERLDLCLIFRNQCIKSDGVLKQSKIIKQEAADDITESRNEDFEFVNILKAESEQTDDNIDISFDEKIINNLKIEINDSNISEAQKEKKLLKRKSSLPKVKSRIKISKGVAEKISQKNIKHIRKTKSKERPAVNGEPNYDYNLTLSCPECREIFMEPSQLDLHFSTHTEPKTKICELCNGVYANAMSLKKHMVRHKGLRNHMCPECGKGFADKSYLRSHLLIHRGIRSFICEGCGKSFHSNSNLKTHVAQKHSDEKPHTCKLCPKKFKTKSDLKSHLLYTHTAVKKYLCNLCPHASKTNKDLKRHLATHSDEKPYLCTVCSKKFRTSRELSQHNSIHTGERPHQCDLCPMAFRLKIILQNHRRTHTGEKPHVCDICGKAFTQKVVLTTHMKTHNSI